MNKLEQLRDMCKCEVSIEINGHRNSRDSVEDYLSFLQVGTDEISPDARRKMIELDTVVKVQCYEKTPVGFHSTFHYDIEAAIDAMLRILRPA